MSNALRCNIESCGTIYVTRVFKTILGLSWETSTLSGRIDKESEGTLGPSRLWKILIFATDLKTWFLMDIERRGVMGRRVMLHSGQDLIELFLI